MKQRALMEKELDSLMPEWEELMIELEKAEESV
jgi:hypothetical protein